MKLVKTIFLKEIKCFFRDKKSFVIGAVLPFFLVFSLLFLTSVSGAAKNRNLSVAINNKDNSFYEYLKARGDVTLKDVSDSGAAIKSGEISGYFIVDSDIDERIMKNEPFTINVDYDLSSSNSGSVLSSLSEIEAGFEQLVSGKSFTGKDEILSLVTKGAASAGRESDLRAGYALAGVLTPIIIIIYACLSSASVAVDLSVGEKEKGTLKPLLVTGVSKQALVLGKVLAAGFMALLSTLAAVLGVYAYVCFLLGRFAAGLGFLEVLSLLVVLVFSVLFISSVNFTLGAFSKSSREAQIYFMIASAIFTLPSFFTLALNFQKISILELCVPVFNVVCVFGEIMHGYLNVFHLLILVFWLVFYMVLSLKISVKLFSKESIMFKA